MICWPSSPQNAAFSLSYATDVVFLLPYNSTALATPSAADSRVVNNNFSLVAIYSTSIPV